MTMDDTLVRGLYGSSLRKSKCVGYCKLHNAHLTVTTLKKHECLGKNCNYLKKHEHQYWVEREAIKQHKKEKKMKEAC